MRFIKAVIDSSNWYLSMVTILIGITVVILAFINTPLQLQIALGLIGVGIVSVGLVQIKRSRDSRKLDQILAKIDEIQQELSKQEPSDTGQTAVADVITAGLKYYADQVTKQIKKEE